MRQETRKRREAAVTTARCGVIVSLRDNFGFLQPLSSYSSGEIGAPEGEEASGSNSNIVTLIKGLSEQLYFSERECYANAKVGDEVFYVTKDTPKGPQASMVRYLHAETKQSTVTRVSGAAFTNDTNTTGVTDVRNLELRMQQGANIANTTNGNSSAATTVEWERIKTTGVVVKQCEPHRGNQPGLILLSSYEVRDNHQSIYQLYCLNVIISLSEFYESYDTSCASHLGASLKLAGQTDSQLFYMIVLIPYAFHTILHPTNSSLIHTLTHTYIYAHTPILLIGTCST